MDLQAEARARLRDPWLYVALAIVVVVPGFLLVDAIGPGRPAERTGEFAYQAAIQVAITSLALFPLFALFLAAAAPKARTRLGLARRLVGDVVLVAIALAVGWGLSALLAVSLFGFDAAVLPAMLILLVEGLLYFAAWRALAAAVDAPGLGTSALLRRLFVLYLVLSAFLPRLLQTFENRAMFAAGFGTAEPPSAGLILSRLLSPGSTHDHLVTTMFPAFGSSFRDAWFQVPWYSPWLFGAGLLLWVAVPLALAMMRVPPADSPSPPGGGPAEAPQ